MDSDFEFIDVEEDFILGLGDELEVGKGFCLKVSGEKSFSKGVLEVSGGSKLLVFDGVRGKGCCLS